ncbi:MAG: hypothetical protein OES47_11165, partial [Acidobacteriota bacterium]|nr:hypothetical protein [Acidobacteriota bacterium]
SWGEVEGARWYDLVVYRLEDEEQTEPVLRERITGSALSWTPSLDRCLEAGGKYAWSARAVSSWKASDWSAPSLFQVASGPSAAEFEEALAVVRKYLSGQDDRTAESAGGWESSSETITAPVTALSAPATTRLNVDGNVHAESFTGDGSHLSGVATAVYDGGNSSIALSSTPGAVASVTVDQGTSGRVILVSSANVWGNLSQGDAECSITTSSSTIDSNYRQRAQTFTDAHATIAGTRGYKINKGLFFPPPDTQVYHLVCREGLGDTWILDANLSAIFVPDPAVFEKPPFPLD